LQDISLSYEQKKLEILDEHSTIQETTTSFIDLSTESFSQASQKRKFREIRKETTNEKILRMNRIIKTNLQEMFNVIVIASIAAVAIAISQTTIQSSASTVAIVNNRSRR
jgi:hypothetical protein